jgi:hypothetical protein
MDSALIDSTSEQFLGQWKRLVSTTNWEKGQIILGWRQALIDADAPVSDYSDEAWSRRVGNVTPQHVGRLRRVFERFGGAREDYEGLFWSHFQAALDWDDAELWLEGAVQNDWSISEMRHKRWETRGELAENEPTASDESGDVPWDEDAEAADAGEVTTGTMETARDPERADTSHEDDDSDDDDVDDSGDDDVEAGGYASGAAASSAPVRPFAALPPLPPDVNDAFEAYKLCILRHKMGGWQDISLDDMVMSLEALKQLALAPPEL